MHRCRQLSASKLVTRPEDKRELDPKHEAAAADMETGTVARLCNQQGIPFGLVRAISDSLQTLLAPEPMDLVAGPRIAPLRLLAALLRASRLALELRLARELRKLARNTRTAAQQLGTAIGELLTLTLPGGADLERKRWRIGLAAYEGMRIRPMPRPFCDQL